MPYLKYIFWVVGFLGFFQLIRVNSKLSARDFYALPLLLLVILGSGIYADFKYSSRLISGNMNLDTLFHADISAMYLHYGVTSVGLDGLVPILYHTLSHKMMAGISLIGGFEALASYSYIYFSMAPLLLVFSLAKLSCKINEKIQFSNALLGAALIFLAIIYFKIFARVALWDSWFVSESFLFGLVFLSFSISSIMDWEKNKKYPDLMLTLALVILAALSKGSIGLLALSMVWFLGVTRYRTISYWAAIFFTTIVVYLVMHSVAENAQQYIPITLFSFINSYVGGPNIFFLKLIVFSLFHYLFLWFCFFIGYHNAGRSYIKTLEFQILMSLFLPSVVIALTFDIKGGSAYYFSSVPVFVAFAFLSPHVKSLIQKIKIWHLLLITLFALQPLGKVIETRSFLTKVDKNIELEYMVAQLQSIRNSAPINSIVRVENSVTLQRIVGCKAYWMIPAVMERPLQSGLPDLELCPEFDSELKGTYGLSAYYTDKKNTSNLKIVPLKLGM